MFRLLATLEARGLVEQHTERGRYRLGHGHDFEACRRCQLGMRSSAYAGVLVPSEHVITDFYAYYLARMDGELSR